MSSVEDSLKKLEETMEKELYNDRSAYVQAVAKEAKSIVANYIGHWIAFHYHKFGSSETIISPSKLESMGTEVKERIELASRWLTRNSVKYGLGGSLELALKTSGICDILKKYKFPVPESSAKMEDDNFIGVTEEYASKDLQIKTAQLDRDRGDLGEFREKLKEKQEERKRATVEDEIIKSFTDL